ncbi:isoprenylcysteine carboxylmethyltransferase family protein [Rathayibacter sp. VKM Ac-2803]|uniref:methyltransferase family protein n=1 Tax=Rathayibacter sp. VKM Ac-2803 TaxID=2609256 RepID=UPI00135B3571|nr:isoprenylcysteine carboxylmethyltransferase family protein [Rathayibacter sp. VKM Ac-2803]MWV47865.1 isoprenylcysteine carboxylmethyltransferase family protein [Rathayibacter sp. VKM Ac-2803]
MPWGRAYFAAQALGGAVWWVAVALSPLVRTATLGSLDPVPIAALDLPLFVGASALAAAGLRWAAVLATAWTLVVASSLAVYATVTTEAGWGVLAMLAASGGSVAALCLLTLGRIPTRWIASGPFAFRLASSGRRPLAHLAATLGQIVVFWGGALAVVPVVIAALEARWAVALPFPPVAWPAGLALLVLASALGLWSALSMSLLGDGTPLPIAMPNRLVIAGPYRWVRNPMAVAGISQGVAVGLLLSSWLVVVYALLGSLLWNYAVRPLEEADLEARFGDSFRRYCSRVRCWLPRWPPVPRG